MTNHFKSLQQELDRWQDIGASASFWWRDDDANQSNLALQKLFKLSTEFDVPLGLATIPHNIDPDLADIIAPLHQVLVLQHGYSHQNYASETEKKMELGDHRPRSDVLGSLKEGKHILEECFADQFLPLLVPPWNRISDTISHALSELGVIGLSTHGIVLQQIASELMQLNVHVDIIDWKNARKAHSANEVCTQIIAHLKVRRSSKARMDEATGIMTHHWAHSPHAWSMLERLFAVLNDHPAAAWLSIGAMLDD